MPGPDWKSLSEIVKQASDSDRLSKLQQVASEQLAALVLASNTTDFVPPLGDADFSVDPEGIWSKSPNGVWGTSNRIGEKGGGYALTATHEQRVARMAVRYAKALLEITE